MTCEWDLNPDVGNTRLDLEHFDKDFERLTDRENKVERGYLLFFVRREDFTHSGMLPIIDQLPKRLQEKFEKTRDGAKNLVIVYAESRHARTDIPKVILEERQSWIG